MRTYLFHLSRNLKMIFFGHILNFKDLTHCIKTMSNFNVEFKSQWLYIITINTIVFFSSFTTHRKACAKTHEIIYKTLKKCLESNALITLSSTISTDLKHGIPFGRKCASFLVRNISLIQKEILLE